MRADKAQINRLLKTARGQIDGILKMVEEDRYCMDIAHQLMATEAVLNRANKEILTAHLKSCVTGAKTDEEREEKVDEMVAAGMSRAEAAAEFTGDAAFEEWYDSWYQKLNDTAHSNQ